MKKLQTLLWIVSIFFLTFQSIFALSIGNPNIGNPGFIPNPNNPPNVPDKKYTPTMFPEDEYSETPETNTSFTLSHSKVKTLSPVGTLVGVFSRQEETPHPENYTFDNSGTGWEDNSKFSIQWNKLTLNFVPDYQNPVDIWDTPNNNTYSIKVKPSPKFNTDNIKNGGKNTAINENSWLTKPQQQAIKNRGESEINTSQVFIIYVVKESVNLPPIIILSGPNPQTIFLGNPYTELWAIAMDPEEGTITNRIHIDSTNVNTAAVWTYTVYYAVTDLGWVLVTKNRKVRVISQGGWGWGWGWGWGGWGGGPSPDLLPTQTKLTSAGVFEGKNIYDLTQRATDYVCPTIIKIYNTHELNLLDTKQDNPFYDDIRALLMFRWLEWSTNDLWENPQHYKSYWIEKNAADFRPYDNITRGEFVAFIARALSCHYQYLGKNTKYNDMSPDHKYASYIQFATKKWWIKGYNDGTFRPGNPITRNEAAKIFSRAIQLTAGAHIPNPYSDVSETSEFLPYIKSLRKAGIMKGKSNTIFSPETYIPRTEASRMIYRTFLGWDV